LVFSARYVGSTLAAILGAVEPTTAVLMCILLFGETLNAWIVTGIVLVFTAVIIVVKRSR
ncbi:MAG: EamA family transporter, partial [Muribaculaceae bacterium]|nr:EamA family transporter [Muribaculaceae bacterium]